MNDIIKIIQALENSHILLKGVNKTIKNETKKQKVGFLSMLLSTLGTSLLKNLLTGKGIGKSWFRKQKWKRNCKSWKRMGFLILPHPLTNLELQNYYKNGPRFNGLILRFHLSEKIIDGAYIINLDEYANVGTH